MTDKQIIIDGVDVSKCKWRSCHICWDRYSNGERCDNYPNCYFKQLKRKEEELQAQRNFTTQEQRKIYCVAYDKTCETGNECKQKECVFKDRLKYKQALDEIEKQVKALSNRTPLFESEQIAKDLIKIKNTINKAKAKESK